MARGEEKNEHRLEIIFRLDGQEVKREIAIPAPRPLVSRLALSHPHPQAEVAAMLASDVRFAWDRSVGPREMIEELLFALERS